MAWSGLAETVAPKLGCSLKDGVAKAMVRLWVGLATIVAVGMCQGVASAVSETEIVNDSGLIIDGPRCIELPTSVYDATADKFYDADIRVCPGGVFDLTKGDNRAKPGEEIILSAGLAEAKSPWKFARAYPNKAYPFTGWRDETVGRTIGSDESLSWDATTTALPFAPQQVIPSPDQEQYHYADLKILDAAAAYPLDENSVVVALDGYLFLKPTSLLDVLFKPAPSQYREVWYYQSDVEERELKRTFIRSFSREDFPTWERSEPAWASEAKKVAAVKEDDSDVGGDLLKGVAIAVGIYIASELFGSSSSSGSSGSSSDDYSDPGASGGGHYKPPPEDPVDPPDAIDPFYGDCHGGPAYGC